MYMLVAFLGGAGGKSAKNVECARGGVEITTAYLLYYQF